jgi:hypothetical protein
VLKKRPPHSRSAFGRPADWAYVLNWAQSGRCVLTFPEGAAANRQIPFTRFYIRSQATLVQSPFIHHRRNLRVKYYALPMLNSKRSAQKEPTKPSKAPFCRFCRFILVQSGRQIACLWVDVIPDSWPAAGFFGTHGEPMRAHQRTKPPFYFCLIPQLRPSLSLDISGSEPAFQFLTFNEFPN